MSSGLVRWLHSFHSCHYLFPLRLATTSIAPNLWMTLCTHIGLRNGVRTTFGLGFNYGEQEPSDEVAENCYNCCV